MQPAYVYFSWLGLTVINLSRGLYAAMSMKFNQPHTWSGKAHADSAVLSVDISVSAACTINKLKVLMSVKDAGEASAYLAMSAEGSLRSPLSIRCGVNEVQSANEKQVHT